MPTTITRVKALDIRFPTSRELIGSDAMNRDPDYSAAYCILHTDNPAQTGHGLTFTIGRGNDIVNILPNSFARQPVHRYYPTSFISSLFASVLTRK